VTVGPGPAAAPLPVLEAGLPELVARARALVQPGRRRLLGLAGAPGSGKTTLAAALAAALGEDAAVVGMDGFHLADATLVAWGRRERKGAPDTFDAAGYVALLRRLREDADAVVHAPLFRREIEEPIAGAVPVRRGTPLVITEGNYLLLDDGDWAGVRPQLDAVWFVEPDDAVRRERLVARRVGLGEDARSARAWALGPDERNARLVAATRERADLVVRVADRL